MKLKRCYVCNRRIWFRPAVFQVWGNTKSVHVACLRAAVASGKVAVTL